MEAFVLTNFRTKKELHQKLKEISTREQRSIGDILNKLIEEYIKVHGEGNPIYTLDNWKDPTFKAYPAFGRTVQDWIDFASKYPEEAKEIHSHASAIKRAIEMRYSL
jgi:hypothetical protein